MFSGKGQYNWQYNPELYEQFPRLANGHEKEIDRDVDREATSGFKDKSRLVLNTKYVFSCVSGRRISTQPEINVFYAVLQIE